MITEAQLVELIKQVKGETKQRKFTQAIELIINFKDIDVKKGFALNEVVQLPKTSSPAVVCVIATGDMSLKAKQANADAVIGTSELEKFATNKRESRKFINKYDFFLADTKIMPLIGKTLGQLLGPRGKMPMLDLMVDLQMLLLQLQVLILFVLPSFITLIRKI